MKSHPPSYECPECGLPLQYLIVRDEYACCSDSGCKAAFSVLSTEQTHALYDGGPPKRVAA